MSSNLNFINPIYKELLHILKGNSLLSGLALTAIYPLSSSVNPHSVRVGMVGHLAVEAGVTVSKLGLPDDENVMPVFYQNAGDNRAVPGGAFQHVPTFPANITEYDSPLNPNPTGNTLLVATGGFELYSPSYDTGITNYPVNMPLTSPATGASAGLLTEGTFYKEIVCGVVSRGLQVSIFDMNHDQDIVTNPNGNRGLAFWTTFVPLLDKTTATAILA